MKRGLNWLLAGCFLCFCAVIVAIFILCLQVRDIKKSLAAIQIPASIVGPKGDIGIRGEPGLSIIGAPGLNGKDGKDGATGAQGVAGVDGASGDPGDKGDQGTAGTSGRELEFCTQLDGTIGQRYVGTRFCNPIESN